MVLCCGGLQESEYFIVWRPCEGTEYETCEEDQACLPHSWSQEMPRDFRCRDVESIRPGAEGERPPAYCDDDIYVCPLPATCNYERVTGPVPQFRQRVCTIVATPENSSSSP
jgi:hypothetical protein